MPGISKNATNIQGAIDQFLKIHYIDGLNNEFNSMESLINTLKKEKMTGLKRVRQFALGVTDNIRPLGASNDSYSLGLSDYTQAVETVSAEFNTTKLMGIFSVSDEVIIRGTTSNGSIFDVVKDSLNRMKMNLKHTLNRYVYGSKSGKIGVVDTTSAITKEASQYGSKNVYKLEITNSHSLLPGTGILLKINENTASDDDTPPTTANGWMEGIIWQKDNSALHKDYVYFIELGMGGKKLTVVPGATGADDTIADRALGDGILAGATVEVYARQLQYSGGTPAAEYTGLEDIVMTQDNTLFGVNRATYKSLNPTIVDLSVDPYDEAQSQANDGLGLLTETVLRDLSDHISITANDDSTINLVASQPRIISTVEKQMYQFKEYSLDMNKGGFELGRPKVQFDQWLLHKDKFSRDNNVYLLDMNKIGELQLKEFDWITSGTREGILERRDGTEVWEGIMTKYADMYVDSFRSQAAFKNASMTYA